mgnify:CR=1 FL=1
MIPNSFKKEGVRDAVLVAWIMMFADIIITNVR